MDDGTPENKLNPALSPNLLPYPPSSWLQRLPSSAKPCFHPTAGRSLPRIILGTLGQKYHEHPPSQILHRQPCQLCVEEQDYWLIWLKQPITRHPLPVLGTFRVAKVKPKGEPVILHIATCSKRYPFPSLRVPVTCFYSDRIILTLYLSSAL